MLDPFSSLDNILCQALAYHIEIWNCSNITRASGLNVQHSGIYIVQFNKPKIIEQLAGLKVSIYTVESFISDFSNFYILHQMM